MSQIKDPHSPAFPTDEAAPIVGTTSEHLKSMRFRGDGPPFYRIGRKVVYRLDDLVEWREARRVQFGDR